MLGGKRSEVRLPRTHRHRHRSGTAPGRKVVNVVPNMLTLQVQPWAAEQAKAAAAGAPVSLEKANAASSEAAPLPKRKLETTRVEPS